MEFDFAFKLILTASFAIVSIALALKLIVETYLWWVEVKTGIRLIQEQQEQEETEDER